MNIQSLAPEIREIEKTVHEVVLQIIEQRLSTVTEITNEQRLVADLGFESLDLAQLVATLEIRLGVDPFVSQVSITDMRRVSDLIDAYAQCTGSTKEIAAAG